MVYTGCDMMPTHDPSTYLWGVVRVGKFRVQEQAKVGVQFNLLIPQCDVKPRSLFNGFATYHRVECCVDRLAHVLDQDGCTLW